MFNFNFDFELILFYACVISGVLALADYMYFARRRAVKGRAMPWYMDYARSFFPILIIVFLARSFLYEPFRIPSESLEPTLLPGDFILVDKHHYGLRLPVTGKVLVPNHSPQRGDIMVFRWPANPSVYFIKRVIGLPGDQIEYRDKTLYINGKKIEHKRVSMKHEKDEDQETLQVEERIEYLPERTHRMYMNPDRLSHDYAPFTVPAGMYFMMGDNRDASADSRFFGFVPEKNIIGKAVLVWMSWDSLHTRIRFDRIIKKINVDSDHD